MSEMFDNMLGLEQQPSAVDALIKLMESELSERITELEMSQIKILTINKWYFLLKMYPEKKAVEILDETLKYYQELKVSYKRKGRNDIIKGVTEMRDSMIQEKLINQQQQTK